MLIIGQAIAVPLYTLNKPGQLSKATKPGKAIRKLDVCSLCVQFASEAIDELLNIVLSKSTCNTSIQNSCKLYSARYKLNSGCGNCELESDGTGMYILETIRVGIAV